jgi:6-phosphofructokinase 2
LPIDFLSGDCILATKSNSKVIVDTSGDLLKKVLETGVYLIKPNVGELAKLIGVERLEMEEVNDAAKQIISKAEPKSGRFWSPRCFGNQRSYDYVPAPNVAKKKHGGRRGQYGRRNGLGTFAK